MLDYENGALVTRAAGDLADRVGKPCEVGQIALIDPDCRLISLHLYDGNMKLIPMDAQGTLQEAFNVRIDELKVLDEVLLHESDVPTFVVLYEDTKEQRHVKTYRVSLRDRELVEGPWSQPNVDPGANHLIPVRHSAAVLVVGESSITYLSETCTRTIGINPTLVKAHGEVDEDGSRYLLGDYLGNLYLLVLVKDASGEVASLQLETLGQTSQASSISYLDSGVVFIGSSFGDSQLIKLHSSPPDPAKPNNYVELLDTMTNLGPIVDFCVVDRQGQGQVVTCSGAGQDGTVRILSSGIGVVEQATVELPGIKGIWSLRSTYMDAFDTYLVLTFIGETRILGLNQEDELDEADIPGFDSDNQTLWCGNVLHDQLLQVTGKEARLIDCHTKQVVSTWRASSGDSINLAAANPSQLAVALGGGNLVYLEIVEGALVEKAQTKLDAEISCVDITPSGSAERADLIAVGTWSVQLILFSTPCLRNITVEALGGEIIPRSILLAQFEEVAYVLCGLGDGHFINYKLEAGGVLTDKKKLALGTKPITLRTLKVGDALNVFAASDRPTIIYSANKKLLYSNLTENDVNFLTSFNTNSFPNSLALAKESSMTIGTMDQIQKLHIKTVPMHEQVRRIAHQVDSHTFCVTCTQTTTVGALEESGPDSIRLLDDQTFETLARTELRPHEMALSLCSISLGEGDAVYYVLGTAFAPPDEPEPKEGRIIVFQVRDRKLSIVAEKLVKGAVYVLRSFQGKLSAGINNRLQLYNWEQAEDGSCRLAPECSHAGNVLVLYLDSSGDLIVVGDLMKSISLLAYKQDERKLEVKARDYDPTWLSAVCMLDNDIYMGADNSYNLFTVRRNPPTATDEDRARLDKVGHFHLSSFVNKFRRGSFRMKLPDSIIANIPTVLFCTIDGMIGVVASIPGSIYETLMALQEAMRKVVRGVGGFKHSEWRAPGPSKSSERFIDGDLCELWLDMSREKQEEVIAAMNNNSTFTGIMKLLEELQFLH